MLSLSKHGGAQPSTLALSELRPTGGDPYEGRLCAALHTVVEWFRPGWKARPAEPQRSFCAIRSVPLHCLAHHVAVTGERFGQAGAWPSSPQPRANLTSNVIALKVPGTAIQTRSESFLTAHLTDIQGAGARGISPNGQYWVWVKNLSGNLHAMVNYRDLNHDVFGTDVQSSGTPEGINDRGDVLWFGGLRFGTSDTVFLNTTDLSTPALGDNPGHYFIIGLDRNSNALWGGAGSLTGGKSEVFVNSFNLSADAYGEEIYNSARPLAIGQNGHVLWVAAHGEDNYRLWLSTPVPEPSSLLLFSVGAAVWLRGRRVANMP